MRGAGVRPCHVTCRHDGIGGCRGWLTLSVGMLIIILVLVMLTMTTK